jgi:hypothetical protein
VTVGPGTTRVGEGPVDDLQLLHIGVVEDGRLTQESWVEPGITATLGSDPDSTLVVKGAGVPPRLDMFLYRNGRYFLGTTDPMSGRLSSDRSEVELQDLRERGAARRQGPVWWVPLDPPVRGQVEFGPRTMLFHFVPMPRAEPVLHGVDWSRVDWPFVAAHLLAAVLGLAFMVSVESLPPEDPSLENLPGRFARVLLPEELVEPEEVDTPPLERETVDADAEVDESLDEAVAARPDETPEQREQRLREKVQESGLVALIGARNVDADNAVANLLGDPSRLRADLDQALAGMSNLKIARFGDTGVREGSQATGLADVGDLGAAGGGEAARMARETVEVRAEVEVGATEALSTGRSDMDQIGRVMRRYLGRIKACYERDLKNSPQLQGKIKVKFRVGAGGEVASAATLENTTGSTSLATCIVNRIRRIRFPPEAEGAEVIWPLNLFPS